MAYYIQATTTEGSNGAYIQMDVMSQGIGGGATRISWDIICEAKRGGTDFIPFGRETSSTRIFFLKSDNSIELRVDNQTFNVPSGTHGVDLDEFHVYKLEHREVNTTYETKLYIDDALITTWTLDGADQWILPDRLFCLGTSTRHGAIKYYQYIDNITAANSRTYDADASGGTGTVVPETTGNGADGTQGGTWPGDDSEWISYTAAVAPTVTSVSDNDIIRDGENPVTIVGTALDTVTAAVLATDGDEYTLNVFSSYSAASATSATFSLVSLGALPLTSQSWSHKLTLTNANGSVVHQVELYPAVGFQVVELAGTIVTSDPESLFAPYTGPDPVAGDQYIVPETTTGGAAIVGNADSTALYDYTGIDPVPETDDHSVEWWSSDGTSRVWSSGTINLTAVTPQISSVAVPANGTYGPGDTLSFTVNWAEAVTVTGTPQLSLTLGSETVLADYASGSGTTALVFSVAVPSGATHSGALSVDSLGLNGGTIQDGDSNAATLTLNNVASTAGITIDATTPTVVSVSGPASGTYTVGNNLDFIVNFSETVNITGTPRLALDIGGAVQYANFNTKTGVAAARFRYTVQTGDLDTDGVGITGLEANGGTIEDGVGNAAVLTLNNVADLSEVLVDASGPQILGIDVPAADTYGSGEVLSFTVNWSEEITVTGTPRLALDVGGTMLYADYASGTGTTALVFSHTVAQDDLLDTDGITVTALELNGGTLAGSDSIAADLTLQSVGDTSGVLVDTTAPTGTLSQTAVNTAQPALSGTVDDTTATVTVSPGSVAATNNGDGSWSLASGQITALTEGNNTVTVVFADAEGNSSTIQQVVILDTTAPTVALDDVTTEDTTPTLTGTCNDNTATISVEIEGDTYTTSVGNGTWTVTASTPLSLGAHTATVTATDPAGNTAQDTATITITDSSAPTISSVTPPAAGVYDVGGVLSITVNYSEPVTVTGAPFIPVAVGGNTRNFVYASGTGTSAIVFSYTVVSGDDDTDGLGIGNIDLNAGSMSDASGNAAPLTLNSPVNSGIIVDTVAAAITINDLETINTTPSVTGTCDEATATLTLVVNGVTYNPIPLNNGNWTQQLQATPIGQYTMTLNAVDVAGHASTEATATLTIKEDVQVSDPAEPDRLTNALTLLKRRLGRYTANPTELDDFLFDELKATQQRLESEATLPWFLQTRNSALQTTTNRAHVTLPYNWLRLREEWDLPVQLQKADGTWAALGVYSYDQLWENTSSTAGFPTAAAIDGLQLILGPKPDRVYQLQLAYYKKEPELTIGGIVSNAWLKYAFDLMVAETGLIVAQNYLGNTEAVQLFAAMAERARRSLEHTNVAVEVAAMESWELRNGH